MKINKVVFIVLSLALLVFSGCSKDAKVNDLIGKNSSQQLDEFNQAVDNFTQSVNDLNQQIDNIQQDKVQIDMTKQYSQQNLKIGSWNIENFGQSKINDNRINTIVDKLDNYDIIAIQEISNINEEVDPSCSRNQFDGNNQNYMLIQSTLNSLLPVEYEVEISPQVDDERYGFVYNSNKVKLISCWFSQDKNSGELCSPSSTGLMKRENYNCMFEVNNKQLVLSTAHTSPSNNFQELQGSKIFFDLEREKHKNTILLGDLNYDCDYIKFGDVFANYNKIQFPDTTVSKNSCGYDIFIYDLKDFIYSGKSNVDTSINDDVSDHYIIDMEVIVR